MIFKINITKLKLSILYVVAFFIIYESGTIPSIVSIFDLFIDKILFFFFTFVVCLLAVNKKKIINSLIQWIIIIIIFSILNLLIYSSTTLNLIYRLLIFLALYVVFSYCENFKIDFDLIICRTIFAIAITSLVIYVFAHILAFPIPHNYFYLNDKGLTYVSYFGLYYDQGYPNVQFGLNIFRMTGPFWEPGVFQIFLNYALFRFIFKQKVNVFVIFVLIIDLILCMSASGFVCAICIIVFKISKLKNFTKNSTLLILISFISIGALSVAFVILSKFSETFANKSSSFIRLNDFILASKIFIENPILGIGFNNTRPFEISNDFNTTQFLGCSNGFMTIAYTTGSIGLIFVITPFIKNIIRASSKCRPYIFFYTLMILFFNFVEPIYYFPFMLYILAKAYYGNCTKDWSSLRGHNSL